VNSVAGDLTDTLDFNQVPRKVKPIAAPNNKTYFLHMKIKDARPSTTINQGLVG
jgi:hypothetical protein